MNWKLGNLNHEGDGFAATVEGSITVSGTLTSGYPLDSLRVQLNDWQQSPTSAGKDRYQFEFADVPLQKGSNSLTLSVYSPGGNASQNLVLTYIPEGTVAAPQIQAISPASGASLNQASFTLSGQVHADGGHVQLTLNGQPIALSADPVTPRFQEVLSFANGQKTVSATLVATDALGKSTTQNLSWSRDDHAPEIVLDSALAPFPTANPITQQPYSFSGSIEDDNLASVSLNGEPLDLNPTSNGQYHFSHALSWPMGQAYTVEVTATDLSGNLTRQVWLLGSDAVAGLTILAPAENTALMADGNSLNLPVAARVEGAATGLTVSAHFDSGADQPLSFAESVASGSLSVPTASGQHTLTFTLSNGSSVLQTATRTVEVKSAADVPLQLIQFTPNEGAHGIEPNAFITLGLSKTIDPARLSVSLNETAHGESWVSQDPSGTDFTQAKGYQLVKVDREAEPVPGGLSVLPGGNLIAFYPSRVLAFGAAVQVDVRYQEPNQPQPTSLGRWQFNVRPLPTFATGGVIDSLNQPVIGVEVELAQVGRSTVSNADGMFGFGLGEPANRDLPSGLYELIINRNSQNAAYGEARYRINVQQGVHNDLGSFRVPILNPNAVPVAISGGQTLTLANGDLTLDLSNAHLRFPDGKASGTVRMQFYPFEVLPVKFSTQAAPQWLFGAQPLGIEVEGSVTLTFTTPAVYGGYEYLPPEGSYVVLVGYDEASSQVVPVGVGKLAHHQVISQGAVPLSRLDYVGYSLASFSLQDSLKAYAEGKTSLDEVKAQLTQASTHPTTHSSGADQ